LAKHKRPVKNQKLFGGRRKIGYQQIGAGHDFLNLDIRRTEKQAANTLLRILAQRVPHRAVTRTRFDGARDQGMWLDDQVTTFGHRLADVSTPFKKRTQRAVCRCIEHCRARR
jgi:hypothetical protein